MFAIAMDKSTMISDMVDYAPNGGGRSWNLRFRHAFQDWETGIFYDFLRISHPSYLEGVMTP